MSKRNGKLWIPGIGMASIATLLTAVCLGAAPMTPPAAAPAAAPAAPAASAPAVDQHGPTIMDTYKGHFLTGTAADVPQGFSEADLKALKENFNVITPENCLKPGNVHPSAEQYNWTRADAFVQWATDAGIKIQGHNLAWHSQTTSWMFQGVDKEAGLKQFTDHITTVVSRYKGKIWAWDVVNEAINDGGNAQTAETENLRQSLYTRAIGPEFLTIAFKTAPGASLLQRLQHRDRPQARKLDEFVEAPDQGWRAYLWCGHPGALEYQRTVCRD
jgi:GH35 family endo-1,4-beta-xylanase